jgi:hypothetical protein
MAKRPAKKQRKPTAEDAKNAAALIAQGALMLGWDLGFKGKDDAVEYIVLGKPDEVARILDLIERAESN